MPVILVGTSGWQYRHWRTRFYPAGLSPSRWLEFYARRFATVELNASFYRLPERATFAAWRERTPGDFVFAAKLSRYLTHVRRLREPAEPVARFLDRAGGLGDRLGPVLVQLPPDLPADPDALAAVPLNALLRLLPIPPKIEGKLIATGGVFRQGKQLRLRLFPEERAEFEAEWMELNILYEDDFTLVVNKPPGLEVHPSERGQRNTLAHKVASYYEMTDQRCRIRHIHRLDKDTTGPVLYAKNELAHYVFDAAMREKRIERMYIALAEGVIEQDSGVIDAPIGQDRHHPTRRRVSHTGEPAVTRYEVVERFADHTLVRLRLETGRTHQIRVHLSHIGHPIAGDGLYGGHRPLMQRQALHGEFLIWPHPWTGEAMKVKAPLPDDFAAALRALREGKRAE